MITTKQAAKMLKLSDIRLRQLLQEGRIVGAEKFGHAWMVPDDPVISPPLQAKHRPKK